VYGAAVALVVVTSCGRLGFEDARVADAGVEAPDDGPGTVAIDAELPVVCGSAYQAVGGLTSLYRSGLAASFAAAERDCESDGGHLIVVDSAAEDTYAVSFGQGWIGFSDSASEGVFRSVTGNLPGFTRYDVGEPNSTGGTEDCLEITGTGWNDTPCTLVRLTTCECDGVPADTTAWCETDLEATCGDCGTTCDGGQVCSAQLCQ